MGHQSGSSSFRVLFESALQDYQNQTGITLTEHPLVQQLQNCDSVGSITTLLEGQARALGEFQGSDRMTKSLKSVVSVICSLSASAVFGDVSHLVRRNMLVRCSASLMPDPQPLSPVKAINAGLAILLAVCSFIRSYMHALGTLKYIRPQKASIPPMMHLSICSSPSSSFSTISTYMHSRLLRPQ